MKGLYTLYDFNYMIFWKEQNTETAKKIHECQMFKEGTLKGTNADTQITNFSL